MKYRYHLLKYKGPASRLSCPSCGRRHCFAPYVDDNDNIYGEEYGRCDYESSCGYVKYPPSDFKEEWKPEFNGRKRVEAHFNRRYARSSARPQLEVSLHEDICTIPMEIVTKTVRLSPASDFLAFLSTLFDKDTVRNVVSEYFLGVTKSRDAIFYQIDIEGRCRTGKVMKYDRLTGHRIKSAEAKTHITWVHSLLKQRSVLPASWELTQCLFGEHLLKKHPDRQVILVEAEKTAVIGYACLPQFVWVAVGGKSQLGDKVEVLHGQTVIAFPDVDSYGNWTEKVRERPHLNIQVSDYVNRYAEANGLDSGADVADVLIHWLRNGGSPMKLQQQPSPAELTHPDNPVLQEVLSHISPQYRAEVAALIDDLGLEVVGRRGRLSIMNKHISPNQFSDL